MKKVKICGVNFDIVEVDDLFNSDSTHFGQIDFVKGKIYVNSELSEDAKMETIVHEVTHGILVYIGRSDLSNDEQFVQALGNVIYQTFKL